MTLTSILNQAIARKMPTLLVVPCYTPFGHMPSRGETIDIEGFQFKVTNSDNRRILQLQVTIPKADDNDSEETANWSHPTSKR